MKASESGRNVKSLVLFLLCNMTLVIAILNSNQINLCVERRIAITHDPSTGDIDNRYNFRLDNIELIIIRFLLDLK